MSLGGASSVVIDALTNAAAGIVRQIVLYFLTLMNFSATCKF